MYKDTNLDVEAEIVIRAIRRLQIQVTDLKRIFDVARASNAAVINPIAYDLLVHHVARLGELSGAQLRSLALADELGSAVADIHESALALIAPEVSRPQ